MAKQKINLDVEYTHTGKLFGPGVVEVEDAVYNDLLAAVERRAERTGVQVDTSATKAVDLSALGDEELLAEMRKRKAANDAAKKAAVADPAADAAAKAAADAAAAKAAADAAATA